MFDTSPLFLAKGETKPFLHVDLDNKTLESWFDLHPSLENSFDLNDFVTSAVSESAGRDTLVPDSVVLTATVASSATDLLTLSSAATSQHLAEIERRAGPSSSGFVSQPSGPVPVTSPSGHHHDHRHHHGRQRQQHHQGYQQSLSPSLTSDEVSQALSDDSCVFMPEYEQLPVTMTVPSSTSTSGATWGAPDTFFTSTVKTEDLGLTACSLEASLPGFTPTSHTHTSTASSSSYSASDVTKMEVGYGDGVVSPRYSRMGATPLSPARSARSLSESSTTSTLPDSPGRRTSTGSKAGSKRRHVPKGSEEYKEKRARNNVAVRKSRAKAKEKQRVTETRVKELSDHNDALQKKVEMLTKELTVLRGLFVNVGAALPDDFARLLEEQSS